MMIDAIIKDDRKLIIALKQGDMVAYEHIYKKYYNELFLFALSYMLIKEEAHDAIHDAFVSIIENSSKISITTDIRGYLYLTVKNNCLNKLKHFKVVQKNKTGITEMLKYQTKTNNLESERLESKIKKLINQLPPQQQNVIYLKLQGKNYDEIAELLNISKVTVNEHIKRAYRFFRDNIKLEMIVFLILMSLIF